MEKFVLKDAVEVPKLGLRALRFLHKPTNLTHLHVEKKGDANRVFSLAFKTDAPDKTGVPHILEHTTLCGSEKYPVRDPFFKMLTRSLANFMNAMTGFDYTYYPFATTNKADYHNLQRVYMDSVFAPLLKEQDFQQEGWRLEPSELAAGRESRLVFKGVVYNEMKGQMSMPAYQHYIAWFMSIYPSMQYSAGDPLHIPELRHEDLVNYHRSHYHPGNCFTFSYGDFDVAEAVAPLNEYLDKFAQQGARPTERTVPQPIELKETVQKTQYGPIDPMFDANRQHKISLTWYVGSGADLTETLVWRVLGLLLADGHASPFYQALIDSGIGSEFSVNTGFEETPGKLMFTIGLQGIEEEKIPLFKKAVFETIEKIKKDGFSQERVDALLHQAEFGDREVDANYGMGVLSKMVNRAFHPNDDFMKLVDNEKRLRAFKEKLAATPDLFKQEIAAHIGSAKPYFEFLMAPSTNYEQDRAEAESKLLADKLAGMSEKDVDEAIQKAKELEEATKAPQNLEVLPTVTTKDITREVRKYPVVQTRLEKGVNLITRETGTQGISYARILRTLPQIPKDLVPYLMIYSDALTNVGTQTHSMAELEDLVKLNTGSLSVSAAVKPWGSLELGYGASALDGNLKRMYELLAELAREPKLTNLGKLKVILDSSAANVTNSLSQSGHRYAISRASAAISPRRAAEDSLSGFTFVKLIQQLSAQTEEQLERSLLPQLRQIHELPWSIRAIGLTHSPSTETHERHVQTLNELIKSFSASSAPDAPYSAQLNGRELTEELSEEWNVGPSRTMVSIPSFQISHVGAAVKGCGESLSHKDHAALQVLANLMTHKHLHTEIREKGGAYGGGASYSALDGVFTMYSYRDPTPDNTRKVMQFAGSWAAQHKFTDRDVEEGKIGIFQSLDSPISPRNEINMHLGSRVTDEERQVRRENLLNVRASDLNRVAEKYLKPNLADEVNSAMCVLGPGKGSHGWSKIHL